MSPTKPKPKDKPAEIPEAADAETDAVVEDANGTPGSHKRTKNEAPGPAPKKPIGVKEVTAFAWKLVGLSAGVRVTLFKAVERPDVEAQLGRLRKDGYYKELEILDVDAKVTQPKSAAAKKPSAGKATQAKRLPAKKKAAETTAKATKAKKKPPRVRKVVTAPKASAKAASKTSAKTASKPPAKTASKAKKKTKAKTTTKKRRKK